MDMSGSVLGNKSTTMSGEWSLSSGYKLASSVGVMMMVVVQQWGSHSKQTSLQLANYMEDKKISELG